MELKLSEIQIKTMEKRPYLKELKFDDALKRTIELLKDKNIKEEAKFDLVEDFCQVHQYFDSSRFDKYFD